MTISRETLNVKREAFLGKTVVSKASCMKRMSFRSFDVSRFTLHERRGYSQAGC